MGTIDRQRIAKNTLMLYIRMGVVILIGLYTSRVVLSTLGQVDYGLYNVVGGIVVAFAFLNGVMTSACNRYFAISLGKGDSEGLRKVFSLNVTLFIALSVIVVLLSETAGLWFLRHKMVIPPDRSQAVEWVYQFSIASLVVNILSTPYRSIVIAREKMKVFAYSSIIESVLKLAVVFVLALSPMDSLIFYSLLMFAVTGGVSLFYILYCRRYYRECRYSFFWDGALCREITGYTGWNIVGALAGVGNNQGVNILLNMFFGPAVNAAKGMAHQVYYHINLLVQNFAIASNPQITKSYAAGEDREMMGLVFQTSKFSFFLLLAIILPVMTETGTLLDIWLVEVPEHTVNFVRLLLVSALIDSLGYPCATAIQATGRVKWYQIVVGGTLLATVPAAYLLFKLTSCPPETIFAIMILASLFAQVFRVWFMVRQLDMKVGEYMSKVILPVLKVALLSSVLPLIILHLMDSSIPRALLLVAVSITSVAAVSYFFGMTESERRHMIEAIRRKK